MKNVKYIIISAIAVSFLVGCGGSGEKIKSSSGGSSEGSSSSTSQQETTKQRVFVLGNACQTDGGTFKMDYQGYHCNGEEYHRPTFSAECAKRRLTIASTQNGLLCKSYLIVPPETPSGSTDSISSRLKKQCNGDFVPFVMDDSHSYTCSFGLNQPSNLSGWKSTCESIGFTFKDSGMSYMCVGKTSDIKSETSQSTSGKTSGWIKMNGLLWEDGKHLEQRKASTWDEAMKFCKDKGFRLPTKEEAIQATKNNILKQFVSKRTSAWTSTEIDIANAYSANLDNELASYGNYYVSKKNKNTNLSYRCIK